MVVTLQALNGTRCPVAREKCLYIERGHGKAFETCVSVSIVHRTVHHTHTHRHILFMSSKEAAHGVCTLVTSMFRPDLGTLEKNFFHFHVHFVPSFLII